MDYQKIYAQIIEKAKTRQLEGYKEKHHVIPKCIGGTNDKKNLVELTAREHFLCHMLLCEIYPNNIKLYQALWLMSTNKNKKEGKRYKISSRVYERIKIKAVEIYKKRKHTDEEKLKRSKLLKEQWYKKRKEQGLIINKENINKFIKLYPNFDLTENNKHCINYCYNNNLNINDIICSCNKGIKRFQNYTKGYKQYCSKKCANFFNKKQSLQTKENKGLWNNSKERLRKKEIQGLSQEQIKQLKAKKISQKLKGRKVDWTGDNIIQLDLNNNIIKEWPSIRQAGLELTNTSGETIRKCLIGLQKTAYGYKWEYKNKFHLSK
jgi:hypothetical protein